jgi:hypothetical protein
MVQVENSRVRIELFNSPLETGIRAVIVLNAMYPMLFDLTHLTWFDHLVIHTADIDGPPSLHPDLPHRTGELLVRRRIVERGIDLMRRLHLLDKKPGPGGIFYGATEEAYPFVELMNTRYARDLKDRASWLAENVSSMSGEELRRMLIEKIGRWRAEFDAYNPSSLGKA